MIRIWLGEHVRCVLGDIHLKNHASSPLPADRMAMAEASNRYPRRRGLASERLRQLIG
jgi:hypothetical protein